MNYWRKICVAIVLVLGMTSTAFSQSITVQLSGPASIQAGVVAQFNMLITNNAALPALINSHNLRINNADEPADNTVLVVQNGSSLSRQIPHTFLSDGVYSVEVVVGVIPSNTLTVTVVPAPVSTKDPTTDAEVVGIHNAQTASAERFIRVQTGNIRSRLQRLRRPDAAENRNDRFNFAFNDTSSRSTMHSDSVASTSANASLSSDTANASPLDACLGRTWSVWGESMLSTGHDHENGANNDHTTLGLTLGIDRFFSQCFAAGIALGYAHDKTDVGKNGSESKGNAYTAALYGSYSLPQGFFLDGSLGYSHLNLDSKRNTGAGFATGDRDGNQYFASLESGYDIHIRSFTLSPYGRADASKTRLDNYAERGPNALRHDSSDINLFSLSAGVRGEYAFALCWGELVPSAGLEYTHNFRDTVNQKLGYVSEGSLPYTLRTRSLAANQIGASLGLDANFRSGWSVGGEYRGTYASDRADHTFFFHLAKSW